MKLLFSLIVLYVGVYQSTSEKSTQETEKEIIDNLRVEIKTLAESSVCSEEYMCYSVGVGSKPCGGFWEYLIYTGSIDLDSFFSKIERLNELEKEYNIKYSIQSDCFIAMPPKSVSCEDGKCKGIFE